jgi:tetratricopeptide (TPR) repeat protein/isopentenyldiphosphate isomerase
MYEPIRRILADNLRQHDPALARSVHLALAKHFLEESRSATEPTKRAQAWREHTYHQILAGDARDAVTNCLQAVVNTLPWVYLDLPQWVTVVQEIRTSATDISSRERDGLTRLARLLTTAWELSAPREADAIQDAISQYSDPLFYRLLELDKPDITNENSPHWLDLFITTAERLSQGTGVSLKDAETRLRSLYRKCDSDFAGHGQELLTFCIAYQLAEVAYLQGHIDQAVFWSQRLVDTAFGNTSLLLPALAYASLGSNLKRASEFRSAIAEFNHSIRCFQQLDGDWSSHMSGVQLELANCHLYMGETADAMDLLRQLSDRHIDPCSLAEIRHRLGWQLRLQGHLSQSVQEHEAAIKIYESIQTPQRRSSEVVGRTGTLRAKAQHSLANTLGEMHDLMRAEALYTASITYFESHGMLRHVGIAIKDSIPLEHAVRGITAASDAYDRALVLLSQKGNVATANANHIAEAHLLFARASALERQTDEAIRALDLSREVLDQLEHGARNQLDARWQLERGFVAALSDDPVAAYEYLPHVVSYAERIAPRRYDLLAQAAAVKAVMIARSDSQDAGLVLLQDARKIAGQWNRYLAADVERIWATTLTQSRPSPSGELLDVYEPSGALVGAEPSGDVHRQGLWHRAFHCWVTVTGTNPDEPLVLFQRRGAYKRDFPNCLDISAAGHYRAGEGIAGGLREAREEIGLVASEPEVRRIAERRIDERLYNGTINREWQDINWLPLTSLDLTRLRIGYPEVEALVLCRLDLVQALLSGEVGSILAHSLSARPGAAGNITDISVTTADFIAEARHYLIEVCDSLLARIRQDKAATPGPERHLADGSIWRPMAD